MTETMPVNLHTEIQQLLISSSYLLSGLNLKVVRMINDQLINKNINFICGSSLIMYVKSKNIKSVTTIVYSITYSLGTL